MTDIPTGGPARSLRSPSANVIRRNRAELVLKGLGMGALLIASAMLFVLLASLVRTGFPALTQTHVQLAIAVPADKVDPADIEGTNWRGLVQGAIKERFPNLTRKELKAAGDILSDIAPFLLREAVVADPGRIGQTVALRIPVSDPYDQLHKGLIDRATPEENRRLSDAEIERFDALVAQGAVSRGVNLALVANADSRFPELAGLKGALVGSFYALMTCFILAFPLGIGAAIYLEEFAPRNRMSDFIEININNLAAVPSVVFGLLALAVFLGWFGLPRSAPFVGGLTLALMTLPTIIIATRAALKAVPPSIREAALGIGASRQQVVFHHVLPLAMPGILTGTIIGLARALGEAAPLLLIGMNAFITAAPATPFDAATSLPTQILIWADSTERGFVSRTSAAVLVLLVFLLAMNALAIFLRNKYERRW